MAVIDGPAAHRVGTAWMAGEPLAAIGDELGRAYRLPGPVNHRDIMDTVRALGLPDRDPVSRVVYPGTRAA